MRIIAFITEAVVVRDILAHLGEPLSPPRMAPARGPPLWEVSVVGQGGDPQAQATPDYEFDQRIAWQARWQDKRRALVLGRLVPDAGGANTVGRSAAIMQ
jgi:hypothetical protein